MVEQNYQGDRVVLVDGYVGELEQTEYSSEEDNTDDNVVGIGAPSWKVQPQVAKMEGVGSPAAWMEKGQFQKEGR